MKKAAKIVLLVVLLAMVGGIVYTVLTWPIYPQPKKNVDSYAQLREDLAQTELLAPPEDILPWHDVTYGEELDGRGRTSKARGFLISGHVSRIFISSTPANASSKEIKYGASCLAPAYFATTAENSGTYIDIAFSPPLKVKNTRSVSSLFFSPVF